MARTERIDSIRKQLSILLRNADALDIEGKHAEADAVLAERELLGSELDRLYAEEDAELVARVRSQIRSGAFAGRFQVVRDGAAFRVFDTEANAVGRAYGAEADAKKAAKDQAEAIRAQAAQEREYQSMQRGTWKNRTIYANG